MSGQQYQIIVNPVAGSGAGARAIPRIQQLVADHGLHFDLVITNSPGHAVELAREAVLQGKVVVAAGGDGTANEVINGLMAVKPPEGPLPAMGVLGVGRGSDFAHGVGVPQDLAEACRVLAADYRRPIDLGRVVGGLYPQGRFFGNCVGVGFDAIGTIDGQSLTQPSLMISVMNGRRLGGGFWMAPDARPDDGLFDLCIAREMSRARMFRLIPHFLRGTQATQETITTGQAARISITAVEGSLPAHADGEILCVDGDRLEIELLPRQIEVICQHPGADQ
jgi:diacylglycerol kinase (ATP)